MADATDRFSGPTALTTSPVTQYTVPGAASVTVLNVHVCNETGTTQSFTLSIGVDAPGKRMFKDFDVPGKGVVSLGTNVGLATGELLQASASANTALTLILSGVKTT